MESPIFITYRFTAEDLIEARRCIFRHSCRPVFRVGVYLILALMLVAGLLGVGTAMGILSPPPGQPQFELGWLLSTIFTIIGGYFTLVHPFTWKRAMRSEFAKRPDQDIEIEWLILPERLAMKSRLGSSEFTWEVVLKVVQTPTGSLVFTQVNFAHWLPRRGFASEIDYGRFAQLARQCAPKYFQEA